MRRAALAATLMIGLSALQAAAQGSQGEAMQEEITAAGPEGPLAGTLTLPEGAAALADETPVVLIVPGSGPTNRDGNSPLGVAANSYALLAEALAARGYPSVRIDKRGMFGSAAAVPDANDVTIGAYGDDLLSWAEAIRARLPVEGGTRCVVPFGHSEGGLVALAAISRLPDACGLILASAPGRPMGDIIHEQLQANPANAPVLDDADAALAALEQGERVDTSGMHPALQGLFAAPVQGFLIDEFSYDPAALAAGTEVPVLVLQGQRDIQVSEADARALAEAAPDATLALLPGVTHVLKLATDEGREAGLATYADPSLPIAPSVVESVVGFLGGLPGR
ncbi:alpha/beta hydrolase [Pseudoroseicyclus sp. H15]